MIPKNMHIAANLLVGLLLLMPGAGAAQQKDKGSYPDIGIMNGVLEQLLEGTGEKRHLSFDVSGSYLPGYGLLFVVSGGNRFLPGNLPVHVEELNMKAIDSSMAAFDSAMKEYDKAMKMYDKKTGKRDSVMVPPMPSVRVHAPRVIVRDLERSGRRELTKDEIARLDSGVMKFLESYADAENRLSPAQRISIVILPGSSSPARYCTVTRKQVSDFRSGSEAAASFRQKVQIASLKDKHESVDIMGTILDKAVGNRMPGGTHLMFGPHSQGIYLKGLGVFFVCNMTGLPDFSEHGLRSKADKAGTTDLENRVIRTLGTYGSSLRFLPANESMLVSLQLDRLGTENDNILIGLKKKYIDSYMRNEIDFDTLRGHATIIKNQ